MVQSFVWSRGQGAIASESESRACYSPALVSVSSVMDNMERAMAVRQDVRPIGCQAHHSTEPDFICRAVRVGYSKMRSRRLPCPPHGANIKLPSVKRPIPAPRSPLFWRKSLRIWRAAAQPLAPFATLLPKWFSPAARPGVALWGGAGSDTEPGTPGSRTNVLGKVIITSLFGGGTCRTSIRNLFQIVTLQSRSPASAAMIPHPMVNPGSTIILPCPCLGTLIKSRSCQGRWSQPRTSCSERVNGGDAGLGGGAPYGGCFRFEVRRLRRVRLPPLIHTRQSFSHHHRADLVLESDPTSLPS